VGREEKGRREGEGKEGEGKEGMPPNCNSWIRPWTKCGGPGVART